MNQNYNNQGNSNKSIADFKTAFDALGMSFVLNKTTGRVELGTGELLDKYKLNDVIVRLQEHDHTFYNTKQITRMILYFGSQNPYYGVEKGVQR